MTPREILEEVKRRIVAEPEAYNQNWFCGTRCCIAGHVDVIVNGLEAHLGHTPRNGMVINKIARKAISEPRLTWLFGQCVDAYDMDECVYDEQHQNVTGFGAPNYWPFDLSREYNAAETPEARALVGCKAIDRYMLERGI